MKDLYVVRKYIFANSAKDAIKIEKEYPVNDCYMHDNWLNQKIDVKISNTPIKVKETQIGYNANEKTKTQK